MNEIWLLTSSARSLPLVAKLSTCDELMLTRTYVEPRFNKTLELDLRKQSCADLRVWKDESELLASVEAKPDFLVVAGFPHILSPSVIQFPRICALNLHAGPLPNFRGGSPLQWQIIQGLDRLGVSVTVLDSKLDHGDVLHEGYFPLSPQESIDVALDRSGELFAQLTLDVLKNFSYFFDNRRKQDDAFSCYWHQRDDQDGLIEPLFQSATDVLNLIRAISRPYPGAFIQNQARRRLRIWAARLVDFQIRGRAGKLLRVRNRGPILMCREGALELLDYSQEEMRGR